ncbi:hypothetical protein [Polaribacter ponticola]|uniref:Auto-transporter adhesin head GIN domain-containing protein n=1 Tax=Polaribacter ponticola TaxID=2978475 RepID=A0ABT5SEM4_9FLAO|nr:hypothetical protein [Polaribacter sp. MSW5]MDD7916005.1 hypothetical protein [Polaribacter sp. MSW5]
MKNLKTVIAILAISIATTFSASATEKSPSKITKKMRTEVVSLLGDNLKIEFNNSVTTAEVSFMINNKNEVVVINVNSDVKEFNSYVKYKLNYKKLNLKGIEKEKIYILPVKINKK